MVRSRSNKSSRTTRKRGTPFPYSAQSRLITPSELRFLHTGLQPAVEDRFFIAVQVPLTAVLRVEEAHWDRTAGRKIRQKRVDFVLTYPKTFRIAAVIELDDLSHARDDRQRRDRFVEQAFEAAGVCLIRIPVYKRYDPKKIRSTIQRALREHRQSITV